MLLVLSLLLLCLSIYVVQKHKELYSFNLLNAFKPTNFINSIKGSFSSMQTTINGYMNEIENAANNA